MADDDISSMSKDELIAAVRKQVDYNGRSIPGHMGSKRLALSDLSVQNLRELLVELRAAQP
jgi:hypothetical protein